MTYDPDDLDDLDLRAWQPPPPPRGLAESVIARVTATDEAIAITVRGKRRKHAIVGAACAGTVAAGAALWLGLSPLMHRAVDDEVIVATDSQHVAFGASTVDLDPGAAIRMHRTGDELHVVQSGAATWHVAASERLVIDAGSSASIEATGASLRVEAKMNPTYVRTMAGVTLTAAAVALVSATAYEGYIKATTSAGAPVVIGPHDTATVADDGARLVHETAQPILHEAHPLDVQRVGDIAIAPGESAVIYMTGGGREDTFRVNVEIQAPCSLEVKGHPHGSGVRAIHGERFAFPDVDPDPNGVVSLRLNYGSYDYTATCKGGPPMSGTLEVTSDVCRHLQCRDDDRLLELDAPADEAVFTGPKVHVAGTVIDGATLSIGRNIIPTDEHHAFALDLELDALEAVGQSVALRVDHPTRGIQFYVQRSFMPWMHAGPATIAKPNAPTPAPTTRLTRCEKLADAAMSASMGGDDAGGLKALAAAYPCPEMKQLAEFALMTACGAGDVSEARKWWHRVSASDQPPQGNGRAMALETCTHNNITRDQLE